MKPAGVPWSAIFTRNMKKQISLFIGILISGSTVFAQFSISGTISEKYDGKSISLAQLGLEGTAFASISEQNGHFEIQNIIPGRYFLRAQYPGYFPVRVPVLIKENLKIDLRMEVRNMLPEEVIVSATRSGSADPGTRSLVKKEDLEKLNLGQDLPILLQQETSVLASSDAGAGVGYTGLSIRGSDATRINVNMNGIPVNDAESHGLFWVNMPDFSSSVNSIQIQRGVGTSSNGAAAFGASLNIQTNTLRPDAWAETSHSYGSFNTLKNNIQIGTGLIDGKWSAEARVSKISSDGFINRGSSDLRSQYFSGGYYGKKGILKFVLLDGTEKTYQAWNGIPEARLLGNTQGIADFFVRNQYGPPILTTADSVNLQQSGSRTYNYFNYKNQTDNYRQTHYQLFYSYEPAKNWNINTALHYTRGAGYYEEYRTADALANYTLSPLIHGSDTVLVSDLVRQRWLDNHFFGGTWSLQYHGEKLDLSWGGAANRYLGDHFGKVIWTKEGATNGNDFRYYFNDASKTDITQYIKVGYLLSPKLRLFADLQMRNIGYRFAGFDRNLNASDQKVSLNFINPKAGLTFSPDSLSQIWLWYGKSQREPVRDDFTNSSPDSRPKPEVLHNVELGWRFENRRFRSSVNLYHMEYVNQLILTGRINDVGAYIRNNVKSSYRSGLELEAAASISQKIQVNGNLTLSQNRIREYRYFVDNYDTGIQDEILLKNTAISFSPSLIASAGIVYQPFRNFEAGLQAKFAGRQYLDNTGDKAKSIDPYQFLNLRATWHIQLPLVRELQLSLLVNNLLNQAYQTSGYTFGYVYGGQRTTENFYFPQAGRNFLLGATLKF